MVPRRYVCLERVKRGSEHVPERSEIYPDLRAKRKLAERKLIVVGRGSSERNGAIADHAIADHTTAGVRLAASSTSEAESCSFGYVALSPSTIKHQRCARLLLYRRLL